MSNIIAYADDLVLLAPSPNGLQHLINKAVEKAQGLCQKFNTKKTDCQIFKSQSDYLKMNGVQLKVVENIQYLGYNVNNSMDDSRNIEEARKSFYNSFNCILRKFNNLQIQGMLTLFKAYCLSFYGAEFWSRNRYTNQLIKSFGVGYHKAIKNFLRVSTHESNHYVCEATNMMTFKHYLNYIKILAGIRFLNNPCNFIRKSMPYFCTSELVNEISQICLNEYNIPNFLENDKDAIAARIIYVQNHEPRMREGIG